MRSNSNSMLINIYSFLVLPPHPRLPRAHFRLCRSRFFKFNVHFAGFVKLYKICILPHRSNKFSKIVKVGKCFWNTFVRLNYNWSSKSKGRKVIAPAGSCWLRLRRPRRLRESRHDVRAAAPGKWCWVENTEYKYHWSFIFVLRARSFCRLAKSARLSWR